MSSFINTDVVKSSHVKALKERIESEAEDSLKFQISIPLKPCDQPVAFPEGFDKVVHEEYVIRYIEKLGVQPSKESIDLVKSELPLSRVKMTAAWRSRGWKADQVQMAPEKLDYKINGWVPSGTDILTRNIDSGVQDLLAQDDAAAWDIIDEAYGKRVFKYSHFLRMNTLSKSKRIEDVYDDASNGTQKPLPSTADGHLMFLGRIPIDKELDNEVNEVQNPPILDSELVRQLQEDFLASFPYKKYQSQYPKSVISVVVEDLTHESTLQLILIVTQLLYAKVFRGVLSNEAQQEADTHASELVYLLERFHSKTIQRLRRRPNFSLLSLPLLLDSIACTVQNIFFESFPMWSRSALCQPMCEETEAFVDEVFNPTKNFCAGGRDGPRKKNIRNSYYKTSIAVSTLFPSSNGVPNTSFSKARGQGTPYSMRNLGSTAPSSAGLQVNDEERRRDLLRKVTRKMSRKGARRGVV